MMAPDYTRGLALLQMQIASMLHPFQAKVAVTADVCSPKTTSVAGVLSPSLRLSSVIVLPAREKAISVGRAK